MFTNDENDGKNDQIRVKSVLTGWLREILISLSNHISSVGEYQINQKWMD